MAESPEFDAIKDPVRIHILDSIGMNRTNSDFTVFIHSIVNRTLFAPKHERIAGLLQYLGPTHVENETRKENSQSVDSDTSFDLNEHLTDVRVPIRKHLLFGRSQEKW